MLTGILLVPLIYVIIFAINYYPPPNHRVLQDEAVARLFDLNASQVFFSAYSQGVNPFSV
jgi:hypothetical protein